MGLEPTTFGSEVRRAIHYATRPFHADLGRPHPLKTTHYLDQAPKGCQTINIK